MTKKHLTAETRLFQLRVNGFNEKSKMALLTRGNELESYSSKMGIHSLYQESGNRHHATIKFYQLQRAIYSKCSFRENFKNKHHLLLKIPATSA